MKQLSCLGFLGSVVTCGALALFPVMSAAENAEDWPKYHRTDDGWRYSPFDQINTDTIKDLRVAWIKSWIITGKP